MMGAIGSLVIKGPLYDGSYRGAMFQKVHTIKGAMRSHVLKGPLYERSYK